MATQTNICPITMKNMLKNAVDQMRSFLPRLMWLYLPVALLFLAAGLLVWLMPGMSITDLTSDITDTAHLPFYIGAISQLGILFWSAGATVCWLGYFWLKKLDVNRPGARRLLLSAALFTTFLTLDDMFLFHEQVFSEYLHLGEEAVLFGYLALAVLFLLLNREAILNSDYALLLLALAFFVVSLLSDELPQGGQGPFYFLEKSAKLAGDACKLAGILTWLAYYVGYFFQQCRSIQSDNKGIK
jgi:hypothetical protein